MTKLYLSSTVGNNANDGLSKGNAKATWAGIEAIISPGDTVLVNANHYEALGASSLTINSPGTLALPVIVIGVDFNTDLPASGTARPMFITTTGGITVNNTVEMENISMELGSAASSATLGIARLVNALGLQRFRNCSIKNGAGGRSISVGSSTSYGGSTLLDGCSLSIPGPTGGNNGFLFYKGNVTISGGQMASDSGAPGGLFGLGSSNYGACSLFVTGFDMSNMASNFTLAKTGINVEAIATFRNCKFPDGWTENLFYTGAIAAGSAVEVHEGVAGSTRIRYIRQDNAGIIRSDETYVVTGGSTDTTTYSLRHTTNADTSISNPLFSRELPAKYLSTYGSPVTATVEILVDSATALTDADVWLKGSINGAILDTRSSLLSTAVAIPSSTASWHTTGMTNPQKRKLQVTFTPSAAGFLQLKVMVAKPSTVVYVDNKITVA